MTEVTTDRKATLTFPADDQIRIQREFDAPAALVFKAYTTPELVKRWWTAGRGEATVAEIDLRVGGAWRYVMTTHDGHEVAFHGEYREIVPGERLVSTEVYEGAPGQTLNTLTLTERDGVTHMDILVQCESREQRDAMLATGMEGGLQDALTLLEQVAGELA